MYRDIDSWFNLSALQCLPFSQPQDLGTAMYNNLLSAGMFIPVCAICTIWSAYAQLSVVNMLSLMFCDAPGPTACLLTMCSRDQYDHFTTPQNNMQTWPCTFDNTTTSGQLPGLPRCCQALYKLTDLLSSEQDLHVTWSPCTIKCHSLGHKYLLPC